ncbi:MAG TPA: trigger factor [Candidatus Limnocylindria bacterium]|nr:trigger factor [Candidatus Limnocylindria bacterium]
MNVSVENLGPCKKLLRVEIPVDRVNGAFDAVVGEVQKSAQLPGFRPGKAPKHLVIRSYEGHIKDQAHRRLFEETYREAAEQEKLRIVVTLNVEELSFGRGVPFSYTVTLEHTPEFEIPNYKGLTATRRVVAVTDNDVTKALNLLREQQVKYNDVARPIQAGDIAVVHYSGTIDGKPITDLAPAARGLTEKRDFWVLVDHPAFIPGFTDPLIGAVVGDKRTATLTIPEDFVVKDLVGKTVVYEIEVAGVKEKQLPEVNDEFAKGFGAGSSDELLAGIRRDLTNELNFRSRRDLRDQLLKALLDQVQFDLPETVVANETKSLVYNIVNENQKRGVSTEVIEEKRQEIFANANISAKDRVKAAFIINRIAEKENIKAENKEILQRVYGLAQQNNTTPDKMVKALQDQDAFPAIAQEIVTAKVLDLVEMNGTITEVAGAPEAAPAIEAAPAPQA